MLPSILHSMRGNKADYALGAFYAINPFRLKDIESNRFVAVAVDGEITVYGRVGKRNSAG